jgi:hypothetical protein
MKTERIHGLKSNCRAIALAAITALAMLAVLPNNASAAKPYIFDIDDTYVDDSSFCEPVLVRTTGRWVSLWMNKGKGYEYLGPQHFKSEYTSLATGNSVSVKAAGAANIVSSDECSAVLESIGAFAVIKNGNQTTAIGGLVTFRVDFCTGEMTILKIAGAGFQGGEVNVADLICAALQ